MLLDFLRRSVIMRKLIWRRTHGFVIAGPFMGMQYTNEAVGSALLPKLLGTYEKELFGSIAHLIRSQPALVVNVGAAEGYYAIGFALSCPGTRILAFETSKQGRVVLAKLAEINGVARQISILGKCDLDILSRAVESAISERVVAVVDVEGFEDVLLDPSQVPALKETAILVEVHEHAVTGVTQRLNLRFGDTHEIEQINPTNRCAEDYPFNASWHTWLPRRYSSYPIDELRNNPVSWMWMTPKSGPWVN